MRYLQKYTKHRERQIEAFRGTFFVLRYMAIKKLRCAKRYLPQGYQRGKNYLKIA